MDIIQFDLDDTTHLLLGRVPAATADEVLDEVLRTAAWNQERVKMFGREVPQPRLTSWYGIGWSAESGYVSPLPALPWPPNTARLRDTLGELAGRPFNSALANLYRGGSDSVDWHADDEAPLGQDPVIASVSLGSARRFKLKPKQCLGAPVQLDLQHGDVVIMSAGCQGRWTHSVPKTKKPVGKRINLTFRQYQSAPRWQIDSVR